MDIGSNWKELSIYIYDNLKMKIITLDVMKLLNEYKDVFKNIVIDTSWVYGPNIKIQINIGHEENAAIKMDELFSRIKNEVNKHADKNEEIDYKKYELISERLSLIENYKGNILPLKKNYSVVEENINIESFKTIYDKNFYIEIKDSITKFLCDSYEYFFGLDEEEKDIYLMKLMIILAHNNLLENKKNAGIKYAYLTYKSHYEGFIKQLDNSKSKEKIINVINKKTQKIQNFQGEQFAKFLDSIESRFINYSEKDRTEMINWFKLVDCLLKKFKNALIENKVNFQDYHDIDFFLSNTDDLSEFHKNLAANHKLKNLLRSEDILKYRLCINTFYSMLPLIYVSPLKKHALCKYVCDAVENHYKMDYISIMEERTSCL